MIFLERFRVSAAENSQNNGLLLPYGSKSDYACSMGIVEHAYEMARVALQDLPLRWTHVQGVAKRANHALSLFSFEDGQFLISAALLHDVGYSKSLARTGFHPLDGAYYMHESGISGRLCALVAHHSCAYLEAELRGFSVELGQWEDEQTPLRDALWWADMTTSPDGELTSLQERISEIQQRYGPEDLVTTFIRNANGELEAAVNRTEERLRSIRRIHDAK